MSLLCMSSRATDHGGNHGSDSAVEQIVASRATDHGGNHGSDSAVEQIVASRATDHGRIRDGSVVLQMQFLRLCDHAVTWGSEQRKYLRFSSSQESVDIPAVQQRRVHTLRTVQLPGLAIMVVMAALSGFRPFLAIFRAPPGRLESSASA